MTTRLPGLKMPDLSRGDVLQRGAQHLGVVEADVGHHGHLAVDHVGAVPPSSQSHLDHGHVDRFVGEPGQGGRGEQLEPGRALLHHRLDPRQGLELLDEGQVVDGLPVAGEALVDPAEVGAGVGADGEALSAQQGRGHGRRRSLAVGAGDVERRVGLLRIPQQLHEGPHAVEGGQRPPRRHGRLEVDVGVEPGQRLGKIVEIHGGRWSRPGDAGAPAAAPTGSPRRRPCGSGWTWPGGC